MIKKAKNALYAISSTILVLPVAVSAQFDPEAAKVDSIATDTDFNQIILDIVNWVLTFLGALSVLMIVIAGIWYITSGGDEGRVETAKKWLTFAIVGLVVSLLAYVIVAAVSGAIVD